MYNLNNKNYYQDIITNKKWSSCYFLGYLLYNKLNNYLILAKRLSDKQIKEIINNFIIGKTLEELSKEFQCTKLTISRNLKKNIGENKYQELISKSKSSNKNFENKYKTISLDINNDVNNENSNNQNVSEDNLEKEFCSLTPFMELTPLDCEIGNSIQKDFSSIPISDIDFPQVVFMIVDKKIELEIKFLKEYPEWQFLSEEELNRKTIEIFTDFVIKNKK